MMRKSLTIISIISIIVLSLISCSGKNKVNQGTTQGYSKNQNINGTYSDGTYTGLGDMTPTGNQAADLTIRRGKIVRVNLYSTDTRGYKVRNIGNTNNSVKNNVVKSASISKDRDSLSKAVLKNQSYNVSVNTSNNSIINNWKLAVRRALDKASR